MMGFLLGLVAGMAVGWFLTARPAWAQALLISAYSKVVALITKKAA